MSDKLLVRVYKVGFGDCIFIRVPDQGNFYDILIDCGTLGAAEPALKNAIDDVIKMLEGKCLDLLVVTHPHADHIKGFDPKWFKYLHIKRIWLSALMEENHPQAINSHALQALTDSAVNSFLARRLCLDPDLEILLRNSISNTSALDTLRNALPTKDHIEPLYVSRDIAERNTEKAAKHKVDFLNGTTCLRMDFQEPGTCIRILAPEWDIDGYYLGKEIASGDYNGLYGLYEHVQANAEKKVTQTKDIPLLPANISEEDFQRLRTRILCSALAFSQATDDLQNNTSVVLLLEWRGKRLLFAGDAEWEASGFVKGRKNGGWNVMLEMDKNNQHLSKAIDFLKVGHHGSVNGSPFYDKKGVEQSILDILLPVGGKAQAVVSTKFGTNQWNIPYPQLMEELGRRIKNACEYPENPNVKQPPRTDLEKEYIELFIAP